MLSPFLNLAITTKNETSFTETYEFYREDHVGGALKVSCHRNMDD